MHTPARTGPPQALLVSLGSLLLFAGLAAEVRALDWNDLDQQVFQGLSSREPWPVASLITLAGAWLGFLLTVVVLVWLWRSRRWDDLRVFCVVLLGAAFLPFLMKGSFCIPRPLLDGLPAAHGYSFPSGHTLFATCVYGYLGVRLWSRAWGLGLAVLTLPLLVAWSRLDLGVHWLSDVVAGLLVGVFWVSFCLYLRHRKKEPG